MSGVPFGLNDPRPPGANPRRRWAAPAPPPPRTPTAQPRRESRRPRRIGQRRAVSRVLCRPRPWISPSGAVPTGWAGSAAQHCRSADRQGLAGASRALPLVHESPQRRRWVSGIGHWGRSPSPPPSWRGMLCRLPLTAAAPRRRCSWCATWTTHPPPRTPTCCRRCVAAPPFPTG